MTLTAHSQSEHCGLALHAHDDKLVTHLQPYTSTRDLVVVEALTRVCLSSLVVFEITRLCPVVFIYKRI